MKHESELCERCGWAYGIGACECRPGDCSRRPLLPLRPGRDEHGKYYPDQLAAHLRRRASELRAEATRLDIEAASVMERGILEMLS